MGSSKNTIYNKRKQIKVIPASVGHLYLHVWLTLGSPIKAIPIESFLFWPPLSLPARVLALEVKSMSFMTFSTSSFTKSSLTPYWSKQRIDFVVYNRAGFLFVLLEFWHRKLNALLVLVNQKGRHVVDKLPSYDGSLPVGWSHWWINIPSTKISHAQSGSLTRITYLRSYPYRYADPLEGAVMPVSILKSVVLPAPLCPKMAVICPS